MDPNNTIEKLVIVECSLTNKEHQKEFQEKFLSWLIVSDPRTNIPHLNPERQLLLESTNHNLMRFINKIPDFETVVNVDLYCLRINGFSDQRKSYIKALLDVDKTVASVIYFVIKTPSLETIFLTIIGRKNIYVDSINSRLIESYEQIKNLHQSLMNLEQKENDDLEKLSKKFDVSVQNILCDVNNKHDKFASSLSGIMEEKHKKQSEMFDKLNELTTNSLDSANANLAIVQNELQELASSTERRISELDKKHLEKNEQDVSNVLSTMNEIVDDLKGENKKNNDEFDNKIAKNASHFISMISNTKESLSSEVASLKNILSNKCDHYDQEMEATQKKVAESLERIGNDLDEKLDLFSSKYNTNIKNIDEKTNLFIDEQEKKLGEHADMIQTNVNNSISKFNAKFETTSTSITSQLNNTMNILNSAKTELNEKIDKTSIQLTTNFNDKHDTLAKNISSDINAINSKNDLFNKDIETRILNMQNYVNSEIKKNNEYMMELCSQTIKNVDLKFEEFNKTNSDKITYLKRMVNEIIEEVFPHGVESDLRVMS
jgi:hypothetical protein